MNDNQLEQRVRWIHGHVEEMHRRAISIEYTLDWIWLILVVIATLLAAILVTLLAS